MTDEIPAIPVANFQRLIGFRITEWQPSRAVVVLDIRDDLLNRANTLHGAVIAALVDAAGGLSGNFDDTGAAPPPSTTLTLVTNFIASAHAGQVRATGVRRGGGRRIFFASVDVCDSDGRLIATGEGTYRVG